MDYRMIYRCSFSLMRKVKLFRKSAPLVYIMSAPIQNGCIYQKNKTILCKQGHNLSHQRKADFSLGMAENSQETTIIETNFTVVDVNGWNERWKDRRIGFHKSFINPFLEKHVDKLINNRQGLRIFIPLCGKTLDIKWLYDKGHTIIGVDCAEMALKEFFEEQNLEYTVESAKTCDAQVFKSKDGRINLYLCDLYTFNKNIEGQFDAIWDRASLTAVNREDRKRYTTLMQSLMRPNCRYLLDTLNYNEKLWPGPPFNVSDEQVHLLYGELCNVEELDMMDGYEEKHKGWGLDYLNERLYLVTLKESPTS